jgi:peptidyl-prolyl cis-trans isomerase SurA
MGKDYGKTAPAFMNNYRIIFCLGILIAIMLAPVASKGEQTLDKVVAVVNGDVILNSEIDLLKNPFVRDLLPLDFGVTPPGKWPTESEILEELIIVKLMEQEAINNGLRIDEKDIELSVSDLSRRNNLTKGQFYILAAANGLTTVQLKELVRRRRTLTNMIRKEIVMKMTLNEREAQTYFKDNRDQIDEQFEKLVRSPVKPDTEGRLEELLKALPKERDLYSGGRVRIRQMTLKTPDKNNRAAMEKLRDKLRKIHAEVVAGGDFGKLAKKYSSDSYASSGGDLGWMKTSDLIPNLQKLVGAMAVGEMSEPVQTRDSLILFYLADAKGRKKKTVPIPKEEQQAMREQLKAQFEKLRGRSQGQGQDGDNSESESESSKRKAEDMGVLNPDEKAEFEKKWDKVETILRSNKIKERTKKWIEELKENAVIKNMI